MIFSLKKEIISLSHKKIFPDVGRGANTVFWHDVRSFRLRDGLGRAAETEGRHCGRQRPDLQGLEGRGRKSIGWCFRFIKSLLYQYFIFTSCWENSKINMPDYEISIINFELFDGLQSHCMSLDCVAMINDEHFASGSADGCVSPLFLNVIIFFYSIASTLLYFLTERVKWRSDFIFTSTEA